MTDVVLSLANVGDASFWNGLSLTPDSRLFYDGLPSSYQVVLTGSGITITDTATSQSWSYGNADLGGGSFSDFSYVHMNGQGTLSGSTTNAMYYGGGGDDVLTGTENGDNIEGNTSNDALYGGGGDDGLYGGAGNDIIYGGAGSDGIYGGDGDDLIYGGTGEDYIESGAGNDVIHGLDGNDQINMGSGGDQLIIYAGDSANGSYVNGAEGIDTISVWDSGASVSYWASDAGEITLSNGSVIGFGSVENVQIVCFAAGTRIATSRGEVPVERLCPGEPVLTLDHGPQPLRALGRRRIQAGPDQAPVRFAAGTIGNRRPLVLSPQHRVMVRSATAELIFGEPEVLVAAHLLIDGTGIDRMSPGPVTYYHLLFDRHEIVFAEGAATESFLPVPCGGAGGRSAPCPRDLALMPDLQGFAAVPGHWMAARRVLRRHEAALLLAAAPRTAHRSAEADTACPVTEPA